MLLLLGLVAAPVFTFQLVSGFRSGTIKGTNFFVDRDENPIVFKMAVVLNGLFVLMALWFVYEGFSRIRQ
ncbi:MAG: hypothetical protein CMN71_07285 [Sphingomonadaceae bacterium]|nr:hypothetical protein [Sphingomonadaceae bacterium]|tara:strand:- start:213 stop:422 length:210 start_codon:yes stop_codon:yes gene_type:complete